MTLLVVSMVHLVLMGIFPRWMVPLALSDLVWCVAAYALGAP